MDASFEISSFNPTVACRIKSKLFEMNSLIPLVDRRDTAQTRSAGFALPRFIAGVLCAVALLAVGTSWDCTNSDTDQQQIELKAIEVSRKTAELMWGNHNDEYSRHKPLRWSSDGYEIRDQVRQMSADLRAFD